MDSFEKITAEKAYKAVKDRRFFIVPKTKGLNKIILNILLFIIKQL